MSIDPTARGRDSVGFSALGAGYVANDLVQGFLTEAGFWSRTDTTNVDYRDCRNSWSMFMNADSRAVRFLSMPRRSGLSLRCVKDRP